MDYILIAAIAWIMFGGVSILEKYLLRVKLKDPMILAFYTGIFAIFSFMIFLPLARFTSVPHLLFDVFCGVLLFISQVLFYKALSLGEVSSVVPITGALIPTFTLIIIHFGFGRFFFTNELIAIALLVTGTVLLSYQKSASKIVFAYAFLCALAFAFYYSLVKQAYTPFISNFAFTRIGSFFAALLILLNDDLRAKIFSNFKLPNKQNVSGLFLIKEIVAGAGFIVLNYAISIGNPAIINNYFCKFVGNTARLVEFYAGGYFCAELLLNQISCAILQPIQNYPIMTSASIHEHLRLR
jgi:drug/metabolite transporter (DMT)-like permease